MPDTKTLEAGGELDALVAEKVMGWTVYRYKLEGGHAIYEAWLKRFKKRERNVLYLDNAGELGGRYSEELTLADDDERPQCEDWSPSTDIRAAMEVVAKIGTGLALHWDPSEKHLDGHEGIGSWLAGMSKLPAVRGETAALAICRMALIAVEHESVKR
jgi:hypothetical protein